MLLSYLEGGGGTKYSREVEFWEGVGEGGQDHMWKETGGGEVQRVRKLNRGV